MEEIKSTIVKENIKNNKELGNYIVGFVTCNEIEPCIIEMYSNVKYENVLDDLYKMSITGFDIHDRKQITLNNNTWEEIKHGKENNDEEIYGHLDINEFRILTFDDSITDEYINIISNSYFRFDKYYLNRVKQCKKCIVIFRLPDDYDDESIEMAMETLRKLVG